MGGVGKWGDEISVNGTMGKDFCLNFLQLLLENIDRRSCNDGGNQVSPKSSPLQGMEAQLLQSLFLGKVTHSCYQPCS